MLKLLNSLDFFEKSWYTKLSTQRMRVLKLKNADDIVKVRE